VTTLRSSETAPGTRTTGSDPLEAAGASFLRMAERFRPEQAGDLDATWVVDVAGRGPTTIHVRGARCLVSPGAVDDPAATLTTDPETWVDLVEGRTDGIRAFLQGRLSVEGDLNLALRLETLFHPGPGGQRAVQTRRTRVKGTTIESVVSGSGTPVLLLHGLGASKVSFLPTFDGLADDHEVHALDLPGFGKSDRPLPAGRRYTMGWMADQVHGYIVRNRLRRSTSWATRWAGASPWSSRCATRRRCARWWAWARRSPSTSTSGSDTCCACCSPTGPAWRRSRCAWPGSRA
jgi:hypothetical protein